MAGQTYVPVVEEVDAKKNTAGSNQNVLSLSYGKIFRRDVNSDIGLYRSRLPRTKLCNLATLC